MKILLVVHQFFPESRAGTEVLTLEMAKELVQKGHQVLIVSGRRDGGGGKIQESTYEGISLSSISVATLPSSNRIYGHIKNEAVETSFHQILGRFNPDIVHFNHVMAISASLIKLAKVTGAYVVFSATDFWAVCPTTKLFRRWENNVCTNTNDKAACFRCLSPKLEKLPAWMINTYLKMGNLFPMKGTPLRLAKDLQERNMLMLEAIGSADAVLVATRFMADLLTSHGMPANKIRHIPFGVNIGSTRPACKTPRGSRPLVVGYIGSIVPVKGPQVLLEAYQQLGPLRSQATIKMYGDIKSAAGFGEKLIQQSQQSGGSVEFCGTFQHEEIGRVLSEMDILVVPSVWFENTPLVLCAALASQTPVLVSDLGGMVEIVKEGISGFAFRVGDSTALSVLLGRFIAEQSLAPNLSERMQGQHIKNSTEYAIEIENIYVRYTNYHSMK